jgi:GTPase SAR1 family protein
VALGNISTEAELCEISGDMLQSEMLRNILRNSDGVVFVYSSTDLFSLLCLQNQWIPNLQPLIPPDSKQFLLVNSLECNQRGRQIGRKVDLLLTQHGK